METPSVSVLPELNDAPIFREAFERVRAEIERVADHELWHVNLEISASVTTLLGRVPRIKALRAQMIDKVPSFDVACVDKLADYAMATWHAHTLFQNALKPVGSLELLGDDAAKRRDILVTDLAALVKRGLVRSDRLDELKGANGYRSIADDVFSLVNVFRAHWAAVQGKTAVQLTELTEAEAAASRLITALALRDGAPHAVAESTLTRQRAYTLCMRNYDEVRRMVTFLRWSEGDADDIAPSLYAGRSNGRRKEEDTSAATSANTKESPAFELPGKSVNDAKSSTGGTVGRPDSSPFVDA